jgi:hypothetical protein
MAMTDTEQILIKMSEGFGKVHTRLDDVLAQASARQLLCQKRFGEIEKDLGIRSAVNGFKDKARAKKVDFQSYLVRIALGTLIVGMLSVIYKIFVGHIALLSG